MAGHSWYTVSSLRALTDGALLARLEEFAAQERESTADVVEHLMEVDRREIAIDLAYPSLFVYCVKKLGYSEAAEIIAAPQHRFHFTADAELLELIEKLRGLLRHKIPDGRLEGIFKEAAKTLLARLEHDRSALPAQAARPPASAAQGARSGAQARPRGSRRVPRAIRRAVWTRDGGRCAYTAPDGRRCESRDALEYDHITTWADGGRSDSPDNIRLLCRAHNQRLGRRRFGPRRRG